jgi:hypothetical protein
MLITLTVAPKRTAWTVQVLKWTGFVQKRLCSDLARFCGQAEERSRNGSLHILVYRPTFERRPCRTQDALTG